MHDVQVINKTVTVSLPDWFPRSESDYSDAFYYPEGHRWAGSYDRSVYGNRDEDDLWEEFKDTEDFDMREVCIDHQRWVSIDTEFPDDEVVQMISDFLQGLLDDA